MKGVHDENGLFSTNNLILVLFLNIQSTLYSTATLVVTGPVV